MSTQWNTTQLGEETITNRGYCVASARHDGSRSKAGKRTWIPQNTVCSEVGTGREGVQEVTRGANALYRSPAEPPDASCVQLTIIRRQEPPMGKRMDS